MKQISIGIRHTEEGGLEFFGTEEVNALIQQGGRVVHIEPSHALLEAWNHGNHGTHTAEAAALAAAEEDEYALTGCEICVTVSDQADVK